MKKLALIAAAFGLLAAVPLHAQNTQNSQVTADSPAPQSPREATDSTATTVRRTTHKRTVAQTTQASVSARNNARLNARIRANEQASVSAQTRAPRVDGGVVRAARSDNPLQAINPFAPAEYGNGEQVTRHEPDDPFQRPQGLKLVVVEF